MPTQKPGTAFQAAFRRLQQVGRDLHHAAQPPAPPPLTALRQVLDDLVANAAQRLRRCPAGYVLDWHDYLQDAQRQLSPRAIRYLCWEPTVATDVRFLAYLDATMATLSSQALQGLVWCCHTCWSPTFAAGAVAQRVLQRLVAYQGDHGLLKHWRQHAAVLLSPTGPARLATALLAQRLPIAAFCHAWGLDEHAPYMLAVLRQALPACWQTMVDEPALRTYLLTEVLPWAGWTEPDFRAAVGNTIVHPVTPTTPGMPERLMQLCLADARLGDPRLPAQASNWDEVSPEARQQCVQWLTQADVRLFFDHVLPTCKDQEERKTFWWRYTPRVLCSRPLFHAADVARLHPLLAQMPEQMPHYGAIHGQASALIMDFGAVVVVEVSDVSAACYIYGKRNFLQLIPDVWQAQPFAAADLLVAQQAATVVHQQAWEKDIAEILALCDIRPTYVEAP